MLTNTEPANMRKADVAYSRTKKARIIVKGWIGIVLI